MARRGNTMRRPPNGGRRRGPRNGTGPRSKTGRCPKGGRMPMKKCGGKTKK